MFRGNILPPSSSLKTNINKSTDLSLDTCHVISSKGLVYNPVRIVYRTELPLFVLDMFRIGYNEG